jgi:hypothetical protein
MLRDGAASGHANAVHGIVSGNYAKPTPEIRTIDGSQKSAPLG